MGAGVPAPSCSSLTSFPLVDSNVTEAFDAQRHVEPMGPLVRHRVRGWPGGCQPSSGQVTAPGFPR